jgi:TPR repeat protein
MRNLTVSILVTLVVLLGSAGVVWSADYQKGLDALEQGDYKTALKVLKPLAEQGDTDAQYKLGKMYLHGDGGAPRDYEKSVKWFRLAVEQGHVIAAYDLGIMFEGSMYDGEFILQDFKEAIRLYEFCIERGYVPALVNLGRMYSLGKGVPKNHQTSFKLYKIAAENGFSDASFNLGAKYVNGTGVEKDYIAALMWMNISERQNSYSSERVYKIMKKRKEQLIGVMSTSEISLAKKREQECVARNYKGC